MRDFECIIKQSNEKQKNRRELQCVSRIELLHFQAIFSVLFEHVSIKRTNPIVTQSQSF